MLNLKGNWSLVIFGQRGSGKTVLTKFILSKFPKHLVYDYHKEYKKSHRYYPEFKDNTEQKLAELHQVYLSLVKKKSAKVFVLEEASGFCFPKPARLPPAIRDLCDNQRHYGINTIYIARRPSQLHQDLTELATYRIFFTGGQRLDIDYCEQLKEGLGKIVSELKPYHFAVHDNFGRVKVYEPCQFSD
jgi:hypothetical protein